MYIWKWTKILFPKIISLCLFFLFFYKRIYGVPTVLRNFYPDSVKCESSRHVNVWYNENMWQWLQLFVYFAICSWLKNLARCIVSAPLQFPKIFRITHVHRGSSWSKTTVIFANGYCKLCLIASCISHQVFLCLLCFLCFLSSPLLTSW